MFDTGGMTLLADTVADGAQSPAEVVRELQDRIRRMQRNRLDTRELPTNPALADLVPGGALAAGSVYSVIDSTSLALGMLQGPSAAGAWCAVVGMPDLGVEAAAGLGIDLERLVLVPHPGEHWLTVASALIDVVSVLLIRPQLEGGRVRITDGTASRLASRLRQREAVLVTMGDWPGAVARLSVSDSSWTGLGAGFGHLTGRQATVSSVSPRWQGREKSRRVWLPGPDQTVSAVAAPVRTSEGSAGHLSIAR
ncbi:MAG: hypothetical protein ACTHKX_05755 [Pseudolysinimonas sp.]